jgi:hypothetical protein
MAITITSVDSICAARVRLNRSRIIARASIGPVQALTPETPTPENDMGNVGCQCTSPPSNHEQRHADKQRNAATKVIADGTIN